MKIADGDSAGRAGPAAAFAVLDQLGLLNSAERAELGKFDRHPLYNWRQIEIGELRAAFRLYA